MFRLFILFVFTHSLLAHAVDELPEYTIEVFSLEDCAQAPHAQDVQFFCKDLILTQAEGTVYKLQFSEGYALEIGPGSTAIYENYYVHLEKVPQILHPESTSLWGHDEESLKILKDQQQKGVPIFAVPNKPNFRGMILYGKMDYWSAEIYSRIFPDRDPYLQKGIVISPMTPTMTLHHEIQHLTQDQEGRSFRFMERLSENAFTIGERQILKSFSDEFEAYIAGLDYLRSLDPFDQINLKPLVRIIENSLVLTPLYLAEYIARESIYAERAIGRVVRRVRPTLDRVRSKSPERYCQVVSALKREFQQDLYPLERFIPNLNT